MWEEGKRMRILLSWDAVVIWHIMRFLKAEKEFEKYVDFNANQFLVDLCFLFDYSSRRKNKLTEFCKFSGQEYQKTRKFLNVGW